MFRSVEVSHFAALLANSYVRVSFIKNFPHRCGKFLVSHKAQVKPTFFFINAIMVWVTDSSPSFGDIADVVDKYL